jgi:hypothetical protein
MGYSLKPVSPPGVVICLLLLVIAISAGCTGTGKGPVTGHPENMAGATPVPSLENPVRENVTLGPCPLPPL